MNLKKAKMLRRIARSNAQAELVYTYEKNSKRFVFEPVATTGTPTEDALASIKEPKITQLPGTIRVNEDSFKGVYKMLKRAVRNVQKAGK
jgi:hypothetical protein